MNKKLMALAVAGAFAAPGAALAQASNVQIFGTAYMEYGYVNQGSNTKGSLQNIDIMQSPGSEIGVKGEEALGGGMSAWFQCASTADLRGAAPNTTSTGFGGTTGVFCGRNSAIGVKGSFGNAFVGNWDTPMKSQAGLSRILSDTGLWGTAGLLFGNSSSYGDNSPSSSGTSTNALSFSRRQGNSINYQSPVFSGFQMGAQVSTPQNSISATSNASGAKARLWSLGATYTNGPLVLHGAYENHSNFQVGAGTYASQTALTSPSQGYAGTDNAFTLGAAYQFGPIKAGVLYVQRKYDTGNNIATCGTIATNAGVNNSDTKITSWNLAGQWDISGPHALRGGYTRAGDTKGSCGAGATTPTGFGNITLNGGAGQTGANLWQVQYVYNASKRTEMTAGYVRMNNDTNANYALGGAATPSAGTSQNAFAVSIKNTF